MRRDSVMSNPKTRVGSLKGNTAVALHRNQYALLPPSASTEASAQRWKHFDVHLGPSTSAYQADGRISVLAIGTLFEPADPHASPENIAQHLSTLHTVEELVAASDHLTGRYALFAAIGDAVFAIPDACASKRIAYGTVLGTPVVTSSERYALSLLGAEPDIDSRVYALLRDPKFRRRQSPWFGSTSPDSRFRYVLPNHYLALQQLETYRTAFPSIPRLADRDKVAAAAEILTGAIRAADVRHSLVQALTAGLDSRSLFGASLPIRDRIQYYVITDAEEDQSKIPDIVISSRIARDYGARFSVGYRPSIPNEFRNLLAQQTLIERDVPKLADIYHHYLQSPPNALVINGNGAEIFRSVYGMQARATPLSSRSLAILAAVDGFPLLVERIEEWRTSAEVFARANGVSITDLLYWEQRMGLWGSQYPLEQDLAVDQISPFNNRFLIALMLSLPRGYRVVHGYSVGRRLISHFDPALLKYPLNRLSPWDSRGSLRDMARAVTEVRLLRHALLMRHRRR